MPNYNQSGRNSAFYTHGMNKTRIHRLWCAMKRRCLNSNSKGYKYYGGRGISICDQWHNFEPFMNWAFSNGYNENKTLDRINTNGNYEPGNCRWATAIEQANNTRRNHKVYFENELISLAELSRRLNQNQSTVWKRIRLGWSIDRIASVKPRIGNNATNINA